MDKPTPTDLLDDPPTQTRAEPMPIPPPMPADLSPAAKYDAELRVWGATVQVAEIRKLQGETRRGFRVLADKISEVKAGVADLDADLAQVPKSPPTSAAGRIVAGIGVWLDGSPTIKSAAANAVALTITGAGALAAAYLAFATAHWSSTPTPVQVVQAHPSMSAEAAEPTVDTDVVGSRDGE